MKNGKSKKTCSACGTSPVNHHFMFVSQVVDETIGKAGDWLFSFLAKREWRWVSDFFEKSLYNFFWLIGMLHYDTDVEKAQSGRSKIIWEEAIRRGIYMEQLVIWGRHLEYYRAKIQGNFFYFQSLPIPPWFSKNGFEWIDDKFTLAEKLHDVGIPAPTTKKISNMNDAHLAFNDLNKPVILKPKSGSRGRHTTTNINTEEELKKSFLLAREITLYMVLQEHLFGSVYRATIVNNVLVGFFRADPPCVTGDGIKTVRELIVEKNKNKDEKLSDILINEELVSFIDREGKTLDNILPVGQVLNLLAKTGRMYGGYTKEMLPEIHPKMHSIFKNAGECISVAVAGFDLIIQDPTKDPDTQHWGIIECNSLPFIDLHYFPLEGKPINVATYVWDLWSKNDIIKE